MRLTMEDNRDPRWSDADLALIDAKVGEAMALSPRLEVSPDGTTPLGSDERRWMLTGSFREIAKATSLDNLACAPAVLLEQFSVLAIMRNQHLKGELVQLIRVFMIAYAEPATSQEASACLDQMERLARKAHALQKRP
ncbi:MAG: hypothetical protein VB138_11025 [Burkholderia sp.]